MKEKEGLYTGKAVFCETQRHGLDHKLSVCCFAAVTSKEQAK